MPEKPYLTKRVVERRYNPKYGDDRICECGFTYRVHFQERPVGYIFQTDTASGVSMNYQQNKDLIAKDEAIFCKRFREPQ